MGALFGALRVVSPLHLDTDSTRTEVLSADDGDRQTVILDAASPRGGAEDDFCVNLSAFARQAARNSPASGVCMMFSFRRTNRDGETTASRRDASCAAPNHETSALS